MRRPLALILLLMGASAAHGEIYTWKDSRGTAHYTNSLNEIPSKYLKKAKVLDVATGKTGGPATAQPASGTAPGNAAAPAGQPSMAPAVIVPAPPPPPPAANGNAAPTPAPPAPQGAVTAPPAGVTRPQASPRPTYEQRRGARRRGRTAGEEE